RKPVCRFQKLGWTASKRRVLANSESLSAKNLRALSRSRGFGSGMLSHRFSHTFGRERGRGPVVRVTGPFGSYPRPLQERLQYEAFGSTKQAGKKLNAGRA